MIVIDNYSRTEIYITNLWVDWYVPKFNITMEVSEPYLDIYWFVGQDGTNVQHKRIDYTEVGGYGYANPTSATDLQSIIQSYIESAWTDIGPGGDLLTAKADLLSNNGTTDEILAGGVNEYWLRRNDATATGLNWVPSSEMAAAIKSIFDAYYLPLISKSGADQTTTSTSLVDITNISISISANQNLYIKVLLKVGCSATNGARWAVTLPASCTMFLSHAGTSEATRALAAPQWLTTSGAEGATTNAIINTNMWVVMEGWVYNGANAGTIQVQGRSINAANTVTIYSGSMITAHILP